MANKGELYDRPDIIDMGVFEQILEMDDDDDREFSREIVSGFFEQANTTFKQLDESLDEKDLPKLSELGHFLKGSSAALGLTKVQKYCEQIQNYGKRKDATGDKDEPDDDKTLALCQKSIIHAKSEYARAESFLKNFFAL